MEPQIPHTRHYASVILPVKFSGEVSYIVPNIFEVERGSRVKVELANRIYPGVVKEILSAEEVPTHTPDGKEIQYKPLLSVEPLPKILPTEIELWEQVAQYYLCSVGEVFKAAYPALTVKQESVKPRKTVEMFLTTIENEQVIQNCDVILSNSQQKALHQIKENLHKPVLLRGVTGSGKTEIYITLAMEQLHRGKSVLYMVPEIAISKQLQSRLKRVFGERLLTSIPNRLQPRRPASTEFCSTMRLPDKRYCMVKTLSTGVVRQCRRAQWRPIRKPHRRPLTLQTPLL